MTQQAETSFAPKPFVQGTRLLNQLRLSLFHTFDFMADGLKSNQSVDDAKKQPAAESLIPEKNFSKELKQKLSVVMESFDQLEKLVAMLPPQKGQLQCGHLSMMMHNFISDQNNQYRDSLATFNWARKLQEYSNFAFRYLSPMASVNQSSLKRISPPANTVPDIEARMLGFLSKTFPGMEASVVQRGKSSFILLVTSNILANVGGGEQIKSPVLKFVVLMRALNIEWVGAKGVDEEFFDDYGKLDFTAPSRHVIFRKLSTYLKSFLLSLNSSLLSGGPSPALQQIVRQFFALLHAYRLLFSEPCNVCKLYLKDNLPAYVKDIRSLPVHETCR